MKYDVAMRHQQALDPSAINTIAAGLHNIEAAIRDARNAGKDAETDPAVVLLCRHLAAVCDDRASSSDLRRACMAEIAEIRRHPALIALAHRGVGYDADAKRQFLADGRRAMRRLAEALGLPDGSYDVRSNPGGTAVSGEIILHGEEAWVELSLGFMGPSREVMFRRVRGRADYIGDRNRFASVRELLSPDTFAARLRRELALTHEVAVLGRLVA
jgi:hypothetical protein